MADMMSITRRDMLAGSAAIAAASLATTAYARAPSLAPIAVNDFSALIEDGSDPEAVATTRDGKLYYSTGKAAVAIRDADGRVRYIGEAVAPTGIAIDRQGRAIVANVGLLKGKAGTLDRVDPATGKVETIASEVEGRKLVASNAPTVARDGTIYCSHSKWSDIRNIGSTVADGFVYRVQPDGAVDIVARDLGGANGTCLDRAERYLYVSLTSEGRICRFARNRDGSLGPRENIGPLLGRVVPNQMIGDILKIPPADRADLGYPDNMGFDVAGNLWVCMPFANKVIALTPAGRIVTIVHDPEGRFVSNPTCLAWGGGDLRDFYIVSRRPGMIVRARSPIAGLPLANWS